MKRVVSHTRGEKEFLPLHSTTLYHSPPAGLALQADANGKRYGDSNPARKPSKSTPLRVALEGLRPGGHHGMLRAHY